MMLAQTMEPIVAAIESAGFVEVKLSTLDEVERAERASQPERERWSQRYVVSARRPA